MKAQRIISRAYLAIILFFLYAPIIFIAVFSFTEAKSLGNWTGFTFRLYESLFTGATSSARTLLEALQNTLIVALVASAASTVLGTLAAIGIYNMHGRKKAGLQFLNNIPMLNPDIITGVSLFLLFVFLNISKGFVTVILSHITFCTPYVVLNVLPKLSQMNPNIYEAALDLGATPFQALIKVMIPQLRPGMISGFILAFTMSLDDFAVTYFTAGSSGLETLSTYIYADARKGGLTPEIKPLMTIIFLVILGVLLAYNLRAFKKSNSQHQ
ncbi:MAG: ABC transporter permease [Bacteroidales bacterium]|nr:ABC transporter permease [Bacteroidales bacterium]